MALHYDDTQKIELLKSQKFILSKNTLIFYLKTIQKKTNIYFNKCIYQTNFTYDDNCISPIPWQLGHIIDFYLKYTLYFIKKIKNTFHYSILESYIIQFEKAHNIKFNLFFDSDRTSYIYRNTIQLDSYRLKIIYNSIIKILISFIHINSLTSSLTYLIMLSILHNDMHNENFIFSYYNIINQKTKIYLLHSNNNFIIINDKPIKNNFIKISSGSFYQGSHINSTQLVFDNEMPEFLVHINTFYISQYVITEYMYLDFLLDNGYITNKYWSYNGLLWKKKYNITSPLYWFNINNIWFRKHFNTIIKIGSNLPVCNISYYEAEAYCKWKKCRLITESEFEFVATNYGKSLFPWGNNKPNNKLCNINNINDYCINVNSYTEGNNIDGVSQLIGNVWEWCKEVIYPYNNYSMDYIYKEMSYPYFGKKKLCKGGSFCVSDYLIHPKYRNAQLPECRVQYIGFRVCLDSI